MKIDKQGSSLSELCPQCTNIKKADDGCLKKSKIRSRSQLIEDILRTWQIEQKKISLESEIEHYYLSLSEKELQEDHEWTDMAAKSASEIWEE